MLEIERRLSCAELDVREADASPFFWLCFAVHNHGRDSVARLVSASGAPTHQPKNKGRCFSDSDPIAVPSPESRNFLVLWN